jgi:hypothetical protein
MRPGDPVGALNTFWGNTAAPLGSGNSTCRGGTVDRSSYVVPALIDTRTGTPLAPVGTSVYFSSGFGGLDPASIRPAPVGLRMLAGDPSATAAQPHGGWVCLAAYTGTFGTIPTSCPDGRVEFRLTFPQCWDGTRLDSPDHRAHLAYPAGGRCPDGYPVAVPEVSFHVEYDLGTAAAAYRLSTDTYPAGRPGGASVHGSWTNGWEPQIQATWVTHCVNAKVSCGSHLLGDGRGLS